MWGYGNIYENLDDTTEDKKPFGFSGKSWLNVYNYYTKYQRFTYLGGFKDCANFTSGWCSGNLVGGHVLPNYKLPATLPKGGGPYGIIPICTKCNGQMAGYQMSVKNLHSTYDVTVLNNFLQ